MNITSARYLPLAWWVPERNCNAVGAKMRTGLHVPSQAEGAVLAVRHEEPQIAVTHQLILKSGEDDPAQPSGDTSKRACAYDETSSHRRTLTEACDRPSLFLASYPAKWTASFRLNFSSVNPGSGYKSPTLERFCRVGYYFSVVQFVKQSLCRLSQAFRLSLPRPSADSLDVYDVIYGDFPFLPASAWKQINTHRSQGVGKVSQRNGKVSQRGLRYE